LQPAIAYGAADLAQASPDRFEAPFRYNDVAFGNGPDQNPYLGYAEGSTMSPGAPIGQAGSAIQAEAVARARLAEMGGARNRRDASQPLYDYPQAIPRFRDAVDSTIGEDGYEGLQGQQNLFAAKALANKRGAAPVIQSGGDPKLNPPRPGRHHAQFSAPHTGGPANPAHPNHSYSVPAGPDQRGRGLNGYGYTPQPGDEYLLARLIYAESGVTPGDMPAIGWAAINRVGFPHNAGPAFGSTLSQVVYQPARHGRYQYSFLNDGGSPEWHDSTDPANIPAAGRAKWARAVAVANAILAGRVPDPSGGAQYFFASPDYDGTPRTARPGFPPMLLGHRIAPTPYQSTSTARDHGRPTRNYFFRENPEKLWLPDPPPRGRR
jgi:spore germination cell wall hydrolase CwlJ-like protein